jgi:hypothetical protein
MTAPDDGQVTVWVLELPDPRRATDALRAAGLPEDLVREPPFPLRTEPALAKRLEAAFTSAGARTVVQIGPTDWRLGLPPPEPGTVRLLVVDAGPAADRLPHLLDADDPDKELLNSLVADPTAIGVETEPDRAGAFARLLRAAGATVHLVPGPPAPPKAAPEPRPRRRRFPRWG